MPTVITEGRPGRPFLDRRAVVIKEYGFDFWYRVEARIRGSLFRQRDPSSTLLKAVCRFSNGAQRPNDGLDRVTVQTPEGARALYFRSGTSDERVIRQIFCDGEYSLERLSRWSSLREFLLRLHCRGRRPLIIDAGANIGVRSVFFAITFPTATVIALEPETSNFGLLLKNTRGLNVTCIKAAAIDRAPILGEAPGLPGFYKTVRPMVTLWDRLSGG